MTTLSVAQRRFIAHCQYSKSLSSNTVRAYGQDLADFCEFIGPGKQITSISAGKVEAYIQDVLGRRQLAAATAKRRLGCLKVFFAWSESSKYSACNPLDKFSLSIRLPRRLPRTITREELRQIVRASTPASHVIHSGDVRVSTQIVSHLAILLMASTGIRVAELSAISLADIHAEEGWIRIHGKGDRERTVFITNVGLQRKLHAYAKLRSQTASSTDPMFVTANGARLLPAAFRLRLRNIVAAAGIGRRITPHMLRHTAATLLIEEGVDIRFVQRLLGHQSISTTEIYTHVTDNSLRTALTRADLIGRLTFRG